MPRQFDVVIERDSEGSYVASVPQIPACHTQARFLDEVTERIREAIELCLEVEGTSEQNLGFKGSHHFLRHDDGRSTVVPAHSGETIGPGLLHKVLRDCQLTVGQLSELL